MTFKYEIVEKLGKGAFGSVYRVKEKDVALKIIYIKSADHQNEIEREIVIHRELNHKNIVKCIAYDLITRGQNNLVELKRMTNFKAVVICMEICDHSLAHELTTRAKPEPSESEVIFKQILEGVNYLHSRRIIHRDLKPQNILIKVENGNAGIKISDFGLSKFITTYSPVKHSGIKGTIGYRAPEQQATNMSYNHKVDIFSLGIILAELYTSHPVESWIKKFWHNQFLPPLSIDVLTWVRRMTSHDFNQRPECCEIISYLKNLSSSDPIIQQDGSVRRSKRTKQSSSSNDVFGSEDVQTVKKLKFN